MLQQTARVRNAKSIHLHSTTPNAIAMDPLLLFDQIKRGASGSMGKRRDEITTSPELTNKEVLVCN